MNFFSLHFSLIIYGILENNRDGVMVIYPCFNVLYSTDPMGMLNFVLEEIGHNVKNIINTL